MKSARAVPVLMYHHVSPSPGLVTISPENFRSQIQWLALNGWRAIGAKELEAFLSGAYLPEKSLMLSFDDGWLDNWLFAHPILQEFGFKAVMFLVTAWPGGGATRSLGSTQKESFPAHRVCMEKIKAGQFDDVTLRWSEVANMRQAGTFEFHSHTHSHTRWDLVEPDPSIRCKKLAADLSASKKAMLEHLGETSPYLCWPQGYFNADYLRVAKASGFTHCYTTCHDTVTASTARMEIPRIVVKDKAAPWLARRIRIYSKPILTSLYKVLKTTGKPS